MALDIDLSLYNSVAQLLLEAFADSEISEREGSGGKTFSYVPPERYRYRLLKAFPNGFTFHCTVTSVGKAGIQGSAHFIGDCPEDGVKYDIIAPCFEGWTKSSSTGDIIAPEQSFQKLTSAGLKAIAREIGLGLHLYDKAPRTVSSKPAAAKAAASKPAASTGAPAGDGNGVPDFDPAWDGSKGIPFKMSETPKGTPYADMDDKAIEWMCNKTKSRDDDTPNPDQGALKERARRIVMAGATGASKATAAAEAKNESSANDSDDDFLF